MRVVDYSKIEKRVRSQVIRRYMQAQGYTRAVCFSCGNAYRALLAEGVDVVGVAPGGELQALRWFKPAEVARTFPGLFDATSGHLPLELMYEIAGELRKEVVLERGVEYRVAAGSGETALCLKLAWPEADIAAVFDDSKPETEWNDCNHLNALLRIVFPGKLYRVGEG